MTTSAVARKGGTGVVPDLPWWQVAKLQTYAPSWSRVAELPKLTCRFIGFFFYGAVPAMRKVLRLVGLWAILWRSLTLTAAADTVELTNGSRFECLVVEETPEHVVVNLGFGTLRLKRPEIQAIHRQSPEVNAALRAHLQSMTAAAPPVQPKPAAKTAPPKRTVPAGLVEGRRLPDFSATDLAGRSHLLKNYRGSVVVVQFWATWCPHCRNDVGALKELSARHRGKGLRVLTVSTDQDVAALKRFVQQQGIAYPVIADREQAQSLASQYQVSGIPMTFVLDPEGVIRAKYVGRNPAMSSVVTQLLRDL